MFNKFFITGVVIAFTLSYGSLKTYSDHHKKDPLIENTGDPATEDFRRDDKKKYVEEVQPKDNTKRYVGDDREDNVENPKRRGTQKRYVDDEEDAETFFIKEKKALGIEEASNDE